MVRRFIFAVLLNLLNLCYGYRYNQPFYGHELEIYPTSGRQYEVEEEPREEYQNVGLMDYPVNSIVRDDRYGENIRFGDNGLVGLNGLDQFNGGGQRNIHANDLEDYQSRFGGRYNEEIARFPQRFHEHLPKYNQDLSYANADFPARNNVPGIESQSNYDNRYGLLKFKNSAGRTMFPRLPNHIEGVTHGNAIQNVNQYSPIKSRRYIDDIDYEGYEPDQRRSNSYESANVRYPFNSEINRYGSPPIIHQSNIEVGVPTGASGYYPRQLDNYHKVDNPTYHHGSNGKIVDQNFYNNENENVNGVEYRKINRKQNTESSGSQEGLLQNKLATVDNKGNTEYYNSKNSGKKIVEDEKVYNGKVHQNQQGQNENRNNKQSRRRNGHVVKSFKNSHHKDESDKTEEYYDEAHNEGDQLTHKANVGNFGENSESSIKGLKENKEFAANEVKKQGYHESQDSAKKTEEEEGSYSNNKHHGASKVYGGNYGNDNQSLLGHQESKRIFEQRPHSVPFIRL